MRYAQTDHKRYIEASEFVSLGLQSWDSIQELLREVSD
jgi:hypothetical protein